MFHIETNSFVPRLAVIADDITGSFDTGVQFHKRGASVRVITGDRLPESLHGLDVLVIDAETRHATPEETYQTVYRLARRTAEQGVEHLYNKTDSGLRGNIGMALKAALDATGARLAAFAPAYPDMDRITLGGQQLIDGAPLHTSVFSQDLFDPVNASGIRDLLVPAGLTVREYPLGQPYDTDVDQPTVGVFDAATNEDLAGIAAHLGRTGQLQVTAGCAAFAAQLPRVLGLPDNAPVPPRVSGPLMVVCGSLNPITRAQMAYSAGLGQTRLSLTAAQLLDESYPDTPQGQQWLEGIRQRISRRETLLLDTGLSAADADAAALPMDALRTRIANQLGRLMLRLIRMDEAAAYTPMIIGGDTLMGFLRQLPRPEITLAGEVVPGVVSLTVQAEGRRVNMLSKSGGFGSRTLLEDLVSPAPQIATR